MDDPRDPKELEFLKTPAELVALVGEEKYGRRMAVLVMVTEFESQGRLRYTSNAGRNDVVTMLLGFLERQAPEVLEQAFDRHRAALLAPGSEVPT